MKYILFFISAFSALFATAQDCTEESILQMPGKYLDAHSGKQPGGSKQGFSAAEINTAKNTMTAIDKICKKTLVFKGGQAKASFGLNSKPSYNKKPVNSYTYNLGFHAYACNVQTKKFAGVVSEYQGVLRVTANPDFYTAFSSSFSILANDYKYKQDNINVFTYCAFGNEKIAEAINKGGHFFELTDENAGNQNQVLEIKQGSGYGWYSSNGFIKMNNSFIYRHAYITHTDVPFFTIVTRKQFLNDLLEYYKLEKPIIVSEYKKQITQLKESIKEAEKINSKYLQSQRDRLAVLNKDASLIDTIHQLKKQKVINLLQTKDENWLNEQAIVLQDNNSFTIPNDYKRNMKGVYGEFYFNGFSNDNKGVHLYKINPEYLKKHPTTGSKPALIKIMYRFKTSPFLQSVNDDYINKINLEDFRKLL